MSTQAIVQSINQTAGADLSAADKLYSAVKLSGDNTVVLATAGTDKIIGVLQNRPVQGEAAAVAVFGKVKMVASAAISAGAYVTATAGGQAVATTTPGHWVIGIALTTAANANEVIEVLIQHTRVPA